MSATDDNRTAKQRKGTAAKLANIVLGVGQFGYATDTKETKIGDGVTTFALLPALGGGEAYKVYIAVLAQEANDPPTATVIKNTLGFTPTFTYNITGEYYCENPNLWVLNKTFVYVGQADGIVLSAPSNGPFFRIRTYDLNGNPANELLSNASIEIRVYP